MHPVQLREAWRKRPFQPFRIVLVDGSGYDISTPESMMVVTGTTVVAVPCKEHGDVGRMIDNARIDQLFPLPQGSPA